MTEINKCFHNSQKMNGPQYFQNSPKVAALLLLVCPDLAISDSAHGRNLNRQVLCMQTYESSLVGGDSSHVLAHSIIIALSCSENNNHTSEATNQHVDTSKYSRMPTGGGRESLTLDAVPGLPLGLARKVQHAGLVSVAVADSRLNGRE